MKLPAARRYAILAATALALSMFQAGAHAQSLFNTRGAAGASPTAATSSSASLFSRIGIPQLNNANQVPAASGSFVGRSNRGFIGGGAASSSSSSAEASGNANRGAAVSRRGGEGVAQRAATTPASDQVREPSSGGKRRTQIIPRHRIAFEFPARQPTAIADQLTTQLANLAVRYPDFSHINVLVESEGRVKLQGQVPSDETRKLVAIIIGLEPGVRSVQNELTVHGDCH